MKIKKITGKISQITDLSKTAKEIEIDLSESIDFLAGSFINVFININGEKIRRAYSISSASPDNKSITIAVRLSPNGTMTPLFWNKNMIGEIIEIMGPLGLNTVDKMKQEKIYLFAFGIGAGVVKSIADHFSKTKELTIVTGSKSEDEILYREYFDNLAKKFKNVSIKYVVSGELENPKLLKGYVQNHIDMFDFNNSDIYVCGQEKACNDLVERIKLMKPSGCGFFIEGFH